MQNESSPPQIDLPPSPHDNEAFYEYIDSFVEQANAVADHMEESAKKCS